MKFRPTYEFEVPNEFHDVTKLRALARLPLTLKEIDVYEDEKFTRKIAE